MLWSFSPSCICQDTGTQDTLKNLPSLRLFFPETQLPNTAVTVQEQYPYHLLAEHKTNLSPYFT